MGREIRRVPVDFDWPLNKIWKGFTPPAELGGEPCLACNASGQTHFGRWLEGFTYVMAMLASDVHEQERGRDMHPWLTEFARSDGHYEYLYEGVWTHSVQLDRSEIDHDTLWQMPSRYVVDRPGKDALEFFHGIVKTAYAQRQAAGDEYAHLYDPEDVPSPEQIASSMGSASGHTGHGDVAYALMMVLANAAKTGGVEADFKCPACDGHGETEKYAGQRAGREAWEDYEPPEGEGWQMWETVSEGSPVTPVFPTAEALARWLTTAEGGASLLDGPMSYENALRFVHAGWAPSMVTSSTSVGVEIMDGPSYVGHLESEGGER